MKLGYWAWRGNNWRVRRYIYASMQGHNFSAYTHLPQPAPCYLPRLGNPTNNNSYRVNELIPGFNTAARLAAA